MSVLSGSDPIAGELEGGTGMAFDAFKEADVDEKQGAGRPCIVASELSITSLLKVKSGNAGVPDVDT